MEIAGLDKNLETLSYFQYLNLQWKRRYYEPGSFSMRIPVSYTHLDVYKRQDTGHRGQPGQASPQAQKGGMRMRISMKSSRCV